MARALNLARRGIYTTTPNPMVGAVIVKNNRIIGEGYHVRAGEAHAEVRALDRAGRKARGATLYCSLEPCCTHGRTPPCTEAIVAGGIRKVVVASEDPNPDIRGRGLDLLRRAGLEVESGLMEREARFLNRRFFYVMTRGRPYVYLKWAATLDGYLAEPEGKAKWISGEKARKAGKRIRHLVDAIIVGVQTVLHDDPVLDRLPFAGPSVPLKRIIMDPDLRVPPDAALFRQGRGPVILIHASTSPRQKALQDAGARLMRLPLQEGRFSMDDLMQTFRTLGITSILVEGGGQTLGTFLSGGEVQEGFTFVAPLILGQGRPLAGPKQVPLEESKRYTLLNQRRIGNDTMIHWISPCLRD